MPTRRPRHGSASGPPPSGAGEPRRSGPADAARTEPARAASLPPGAKPRVTARCAWQVVEGEAVLLDVQGRRIMGLNATGSFVFGLIDGARTLDSLAAAVAERFGIERDRASADLSAFLGGLRQRGLIEVDA